MNTKSYKPILIILSFVVVLFILTAINQYFIKNNLFSNDELYDNMLSKKVESRDFSNINYSFLIKDLEYVDNITQEQLLLDTDKKKKSKMYDVAQDLYTHKINEYSSVLNEKLDNEDFNLFQSDIDEFRKYIDLAIIDINNTLESPLDVDYYVNKYLYEEKQKKCHEILENYNGFLN
ncbi:MAG: hypothetical protein II411_02935 [Lachnospiraceae bacterium]|nr:hypothetical protein [Lachnospiraceae bacterium]